MGRLGDTVEVYRRGDGLWDWRRRASNGQIIATSGGQGYKRESRAKEMAARCNPGIVALPVKGRR